MRFEYNPNTKDGIALKDVSAMVHNNTTDVMLPDNLVDARFEQLTLSRLHGTSKNNRPPKNILQYLEASKLSFADGVIEPATTILFQIEKHLSQDSGPKPLSFEKTNYGVEYLFAGLEIRTKLEHSWQGWQLDYTSIKAGRAAGSRSELRLHAIKDGVPVEEEEFVQAAYELADLVGRGNEAPRIRKVHRGGNDAKDGLLRNIGTSTGSERPAFKYFVRRIDLAPKQDAGFSLLDEVEADMEGLRDQPATLETEGDKPTSKPLASVQPNKFEREAASQSKNLRREALGFDAEEGHFSDQDSTRAESQDSEHETTASTHVATKSEEGDKSS